MKLSVLERLQDILQGADYHQNLITVDADQCVHLFGRYRVAGDDGDFRVHKDRELVNTFTSVRVAVSWCIADRLGRWDLCQKIQDLDATRQQHLMDIMQYQNRLDRKGQDPWRRDLMANRISESRQRLFEAHSRIRKLVNVAKYFQIRGFSDEIARTQSKNTTTTSTAGAGKPARPQRRARRRR